MDRISILRSSDKRYVHTVEDRNTHGYLVNTECRQYVSLSFRCCTTVTSHCRYNAGIRPTFLNDLYDFVYDILEICDLPTPDSDGHMAARLDGLV